MPSARTFLTNPYRLAGAAATIILLSVLYRSAWTGDDAVIGYKAAYNVLNGFGPNYNPGERLQVYTSPLNFWLQTLAFWITGNYFVTGMLLSLGLVAAAYWRLCRGLHGLTVAGVVLCMISSRSFIDYSTSGLEVSLGYLLIVLYAEAFIGEASDTRRLWRMAVVTMLLYLTRQDLILMAFPALAGQVWTSWRQGLRPGKIFWIFLIGFLPIVFWEVFSIIYYGFPFPNTYYAKVRNGIPGIELFAQGLIYILDLLDNDPATAALIAMAGAAILVDPDWRRKLLYSGIALYTLYVVKVGGDFMSGRFFAIPFVLSLWLLARLQFDDRRIALGFLPAAGVFLLMVSLWGVNPPVYYGKETYARKERKELDHWRESGIADERVFYFLGSRLNTHLLRGHATPFYYLAGEADSIRQKRYPAFVVEAAGYVPFYIGPTVHILDLGAIADPLFARLPEFYPDGKRGIWRPGHVTHWIPAGYQETLITGKNHLKDPGLRTYYDHLSKIVRGPLFSAERFREIWLFNTGHYNHLVRDRHTYKVEAPYQINMELRALYHPK